MKVLGVKKCLEVFVLLVIVGSCFLFVSAEPSVTSINANIQNISDDDAGKNFQINISYNEEMNISSGAYPIISITNISGILNFISESWLSDNKTFQRNYNISDTNEEILSGINMSVSGAMNSSGIPQNYYSIVNLFNIDTKNPVLVNYSVFGGYSITNKISTQDVDGKYDNISIVMNASENVNWTTRIFNSTGSQVKYFLKYPPVTGNIEVWNGNYSGSAGLVPEGNYSINITLKDSFGNINSVVIPQTVEVENTKPTANISISTNPVTDNSLLQIITIVYNEVMDATIRPVITLIGTTYTSLGGNWTAGNTTWVESFSITDTNQDRTTVNASISANAEDIVGNNQTPVSTIFILDTIGPAIAGIGNSTHNGIINNDDNVTINATASDLSNVSSVWVEENSSGIFVNNSMNLVAGVYTYTIPESRLDNQEIVSFRIYALDSVGNLRVSSTYIFKVENRAPIFNASYGVIPNMSWIEDDGHKTIYLKPYFYDLDGDEVNFTYTIRNLVPGITSNPIGGNITVDINNSALSKNATISSTQDFNGNATIEFIAYDFVNGRGYSNNASIIITPDANEIPTITTSISPINFSEDTTFNITILCDPEDVGQTCGNYRYDPTYVDYNSNLTLSVNSITGTVTFAPKQDWYGITYVKFLADDNGDPTETGHHTAMINVTPVNDAPVLNIPDQNINEDLINSSLISVSLGTYTFDVDNLVPTQMTWKIISPTNSSMINCSIVGSVFSCGAPASNKNGYTDVVIGVNDSSGGIGNQQVRININEINDYPVMLPFNDSYITQENTPIALSIYLKPYESDVDVYDVDSNLTWSVSGVNTNLITTTINNASDTLIITPIANVNTSVATSFTLKLSDSKGASVSKTISVTINPENDAPIMDLIQNQTAYVGKTLTVKFNVTDVDSSGFTFYEDANTGGAFSITGSGSTGIITFTPILNDTGFIIVNISVKDNAPTNALMDSQLVRFDIILDSTPTINSFTPIGNIAIKLGASQQFSVNATDNVDPVNYTWYLDSGIVCANSERCNLTFNTMGTYTVRVEVSDSAVPLPNKASHSWNVSVENGVPVISSYSPISNPIIKTGNSQLFSVVANDPEGNPLTYNWYFDGVKDLSATSANFSINPTEGIHSVVVSVNDSAGLGAMHLWSVTSSTYPITNLFTGDETTNLSQVDISNIVGLTFENQYGKIQFLEPIDLRDVWMIDENIIIQNGLISVNSAVHPELSKSAKVTLYGLAYTSIPEIYSTSSFASSLGEVTQRCLTCNMTNFTKFSTLNGIVDLQIPSGILGSVKVAGSGQVYNIDELDLDSCEEGVQGNLQITIKDPQDDDSYLPGDEIPIEVKVKNGNLDDMRIKVTAVLYDVDEEDELEDAEADATIIEKGKEETFEMTMIVPENFNEDNTNILFIKAYQRSYEEEQCNYKTIEVELEREPHKTIIQDILVNPEKIYPGINMNIEAHVQNLGGEDEREAYVKVSSAELGISIESEKFELEKYGEDDSATAETNIKIPNMNLSDGNYNLSVEVFYYGGSDKKTISVSYLNSSLSLIEPSAPIYATPQTASTTSSAGYNPTTGAIIANPSYSAMTSGKYTPSTSIYASTGESGIYEPEIYTKIVDSTEDYMISGESNKEGVLTIKIEKGEYSSSLENKKEKSIYEKINTYLIIGIVAIAIIIIFILIFFRLR